MCASLKNFNPRSPHGERRIVASGSSSPMPFSIHAPRTGSDAVCLQKLLRVSISIHAPRTGSDHSARRLLPDVRAISIHAPRTGSDLFASKSGRPMTNFNPRSPHGERRFSNLNGRTPDRFQSTLPARGATGRSREPKGSQIYFNPRSPHGERLQRHIQRHPDNLISIHAPRTGSDA